MTTEQSAKPAGDPLGRPKAWLVTGPLGRGLAFTIDFALAVRRGLRRRRSVNG